MGRRAQFVALVAAAAVRDVAPQEADLHLVHAVDPATASAGRRTPSQFEAGELAGLLARAHPLDREEIARLAGEWQHNRAVPSGVRRWSRGRITHHGDDYYDALLLSQCDDQWQAASQAIGEAQWECDEFLGDVFSRGDFAASRTAVACCCAAPTDRSPRPW